MKVVHEEIITSQGPLAVSQEVQVIETELKAAIKEISWPPGKEGFFLNPQSRGKGRGEGNGVKPIKEACITYLKSAGWEDDVAYDLEEWQALALLTQ